MLFKIFSFILCLVIASMFAAPVPSIGNIPSASRVQIVENDYALWTVGKEGTILKSVDKGVTWQAQDSDVTRDLYGVYFVNELTGWADGYGGTILKTTDGGATWTPQVSGVNKTLLDLYFVDSSNGYAVGGTEPPVVLKTEDGGNTWTSLAMPDVPTYRETLTSVHFTDADTGWVAGYLNLTSATPAPPPYQDSSAYILKTADGGNTWTHEEVDYGPEPYVRSIYDLHATNNKVWAASHENLVLKYINSPPPTDPYHWKRSNAGTCGSDNISIKGIHFVDSTCAVDAGCTGWAVGQFQSLICKTTDGGYTYNQQQVVESDICFEEVFAANENEAWAVGRYGTILNTTDGGANWNTQTIGINDLLDITGVPIVQMSLIEIEKDSVSKTYRAYQLPGESFRIVCQEPCSIDEDLIIAWYYGFKNAKEQLMEVTGIDVLPELMPVDIHLNNDHFCGNYDPNLYSGISGSYPNGYMCTFLAEKDNLIYPFTIENAPKVEAHLLLVHEYTHILFSRRHFSSYEDMAYPLSYYVSGYGLPPNDIKIIDPCDPVLDTLGRGKLLYELCHQNGFQYEDLAPSLIALDALYQSGDVQCNGKTSIYKYRRILNEILGSDTLQAYLDVGYPPATAGDCKVITPSGGLYSLVNDFIALNVPSSAVAEDKEVILENSVCATSDPRFSFRNAFDLSPKDLIFNTHVNITVRYYPENFENNVNEGSLRLYQEVFVSPFWTWVLVTNATVDTINKTVSGDITSLGTFAIMEIPYNTYVGLNIEFIQGDVTITFSEVTGAGDTTVTESPVSDCPDPPGGYELQGNCYNIETTASYTSPITVCINYTYSKPEEENLKLYHYKDGQPIDITSSLDTVNNIICGQVDMLSYFGVMLLTDPVGAINELITLVESMNLKKGIENSLDSKLENTKKSLHNAKSMKQQDAANKLRAFIKECTAQSGKALTVEQADMLIGKAQAIIDCLLLKKMY